MHFSIPFVQMSYISLDINQHLTWMGISLFLLMGCCSLMIASSGAKDEREPLTREDTRYIYFLFLICLGLAIVSAIFGSWILIPIYVIVLVLAVGWIILAICRSLVKTFGYAFLGWEKPVSKD